MWFTNTLQTCYVKQLTDRCNIVIYYRTSYIALLTQPGQDFAKNVNRPKGDYLTGDWVIHDNTDVSIETVVECFNEGFDDTRGKPINFERKPFRAHMPKKANGEVENASQHRCQLSLHGLCQVSHTHFNLFSGKCWGNPNVYTVIFFQP